jgi:pimeloyl-ACP methyl ester carboxylesterase
MKDRAGTVGANGVGPLLHDLLAARGNMRMHMIGHSYGGKVVLSAICAGGELPRKVHSVLLLQPAVSHLCFAERVPGTNKPGGYRKALERVERSIFSTFSDHDVPLTKLFHFALRRADDLGEERIAAGGEPPSVYAALGGFGPRRAGERLVDIQDVNNPYDLTDETRIYGIRGTRTIMGHGDISNESTWWALYSLASI